MTVTVDAWRITGQSQIDSYVGRWAELSVILVNELAVDQVRGHAVAPPASADGRRAVVESAGTRIGRPPERVTAGDADRLAAVAAELRPLFGGGPKSVDGLNELLVRHAAVPALYGEPPMLGFHAAGAGLVDAWAADAGTALAMVIGVGQGMRLRSCEGDGCELVFFDVTRNASRRFCGLSCQNRAKASAYRARRRG
jgi:hypothetical protein